MIAREKRILEIMAEDKVDHDTAESLFDLELEDMYPEVKDSDVRETIYESDAEEDKSFEKERKSPQPDGATSEQQEGDSPVLVFTQRYGAKELQGLIGFTVADITDENEESEICLTLKNDHCVCINLLIPADGSAYASGFYAVDRDGKRI